jgi:hypothetical protein
MGNYDDHVYGEHIDDLFPAFRAFANASSINDDGMFASEVDLEPAVGRPLLRAMMRVETELLLEDAEALRSGAYEDRTPEQRAADAFARLCNTWAERSAGS